MSSNTSPGDTTRLVLLGKVSPGVAAARLGPWAKRALCADMDPEIFFPSHDDPATEARQICARCPVRDAYLNFALDNNERYGIWGGLDPGERRRRQQKEPGPNRQGAA